MIEQLKGKIIKSIDISDDKEQVVFTCDDDSKYRMFHYQVCCEDVYLEDVCGEIYNLLNSEIQVAEEVTNEQESGWGHITWTFYHLGTAKGDVTLRWHGESNGYYSESVSVVKIN